MQKIVAAIDFSKYSTAVVHHAVGLSTRFDAKLFVFHAISFPRNEMYGTASNDRSISADDKASRASARIDTLMEKRNADWQQIIRFGDPVEEVARFAEETEADLVIAASHGISGWRRLLLGTVVERLARYLTRPLLVIRRARQPKIAGDLKLSRIVVSCDLTEGAATLLDYALKLATSFDAELHLVHAIEAPINASIMDPTAAPYGEVQNALQQRISDQLVTLIADRGNTAITIKPVVLPGLPYEEILEYASVHAADLIIVGVRKRQSVEKWLIGSTTEALLRHAVCPVYSVPLQRPAENHSES